MSLTEKLGPWQHVTLRDRLGNHRTARTLCALVEPQCLILCAPQSLARFSCRVTLDCGAVRLSGFIRPLPPAEWDEARKRFEQAFPQAVRDLDRLPDRTLLLFCPDTPQSL